MPHIAKILIIAGILLIIAGLTISLGGNKFDWIGRLPGDIRIEKENMRFYFPITTMIILSAIFSFIIWVIKKMH
jgi:hypothetical protein